MVDKVETLPGVYKEEQRALQRKENGVKYNKFAWALLSRQIDCKPSISTDKRHTRISITLLYSKYILCMQCRCNCEPISEIMIAMNDQIIRDSDALPISC